MKKITQFGWWQVVKTFIKYGAYVMIIFDGLSGIMTALESKDGIVSPSKENENVA